MEKLIDKYFDKPITLSFVNKSFTTTKIIQPAANDKQYGKIKLTNLERNIATKDEIGSTIPDKKPLLSCFFIDFTLSKGIETIIPSGMFWTEIPMENINASIR